MEAYKKGDIVQAKNTFEVDGSVILNGTLCEVVSAGKRHTKLDIVDQAGEEYIFTLLNEFVAENFINSAPLVCEHTKDFKFKSVSTHGLHGDGVDHHVTYKRKNIGVISISGSGGGVIDYPEAPEFEQLLEHVKLVADAYYQPHIEQFAVTKVELVLMIARFIHSGQDKRIGLENFLKGQLDSRKKRLSALLS